DLFCRCDVVISEERNYGTLLTGGASVCRFFIENSCTSLGDRSGATLHDISRTADRRNQQANFQVVEVR
ncbi:MAG: hypothetical protein KGI52_02145, partial [Burkholderiales bacterium]|nr:hypothetical protein [Burkholderiales bacterium]